MSRWDTRLTGYEHSTFESVILKQCIKAAQGNPHAGDLLKVLSFLPSCGIELSVLSAAALSLLKWSPKRFPRSPPQPDPLHPLRASLTDRSSPLHSFIKFAASLVPIHNAVRHLEQFWLIRSENLPIYASKESKIKLVHVLRVPALVRAILQGVSGHTEGDNAHFDMAVFIIAAEREKHKTVKVLLEAGVDVNHPDEPYDTALQAAVGVDVNYLDKPYGTALQAAAGTGRIKTVEKLIKGGADVNIQRGHYCTALQAAARYGNGGIVQMLLEAGADVNIVGGYHGSALEAAVSCRDDRSIRLLLKAGADFLRLGRHFCSVLLAAAGDGDIEVVRLLT